MKNLNILIIICLGISPLFSQSIPVHDTLQVNSIRATVQSSGAFFQGGENGQFWVPGTTGTAPELSLMKSAGLWLGGRDRAGKLHLAAQLENENGKTDFYPGYLYPDGTTYPAFNFFGHVTGAEINAHKANPASNVPAVYSWPGNGNPYFFDYYGFDLPYSPWGRLAAYKDNNGDGLYSPPAGEHPVIGVRGCPEKYFADEALWFAFHDAGTHTQSGGLPLNMRVQASFFGFDCPTGTPLNRAVYVVYNLIYQDTIPLDSCYFGVYLDFQIGNGNDDYIGCDPAHKMVYAYNGDDLDEGGFETSPPVMAVDFLRGPIDSNANVLTLKHFVPVEDVALLQSPEAYFNILKGRHADGAPYPNNGLVYTGDPLNPSGWTEKSDGNQPGERKAVASIGPFTLLPGANNELILGYFWVRKGADGSLADNLSVLLANDNKVQDAFDNCFDLMDGCPGDVATEAPNARLNITVTPNPYADWITIESKETLIQSVNLYDALGRQVQTMEALESALIQMQTNKVPTGMYYLVVRTQDGRTGTYKLIRE